LVRELKFVGTEDDLLLLVDPQGDQFAVPVTPELRQAIRTRRAPRPASGPRNPLPSPREVQALLRSGLAADQVADHFGVDIAYIEKFEAPVAAELDHMVELAQDVPLHFDEEGAETSTFGHIITHRLVTRGAEHTMWSSWREEDGRWTVQIAYTADGHDSKARWFFDPRRRQLTPANEEAEALSTAQDLQPVKVPRLRLVDAATTVDTFPLESETDEAEPASEEPRAESGESAVEMWERAARDEARHVAERVRGSSLVGRHGEDDGPAGDADVSLRGSLTRPAEPAERSARSGEESPRVPSETEDLLQALRRRHENDAVREPRGESPASTARLRVVSDEKPDAEAEDAQADADAAAPTPKTPHDHRGRRGRSSLPSWDEIVFGTKPHDDGR
jgi:hypothetical protein